VKTHRTFSLSLERFQEIFNEMGPQSEDVKEGIIGRKLVKILSLRISHEIFRTSFQEIAEEKNYREKH
jgi:hypothetical protein